MSQHTPGPWKVDKWASKISPEFITGERNGKTCIIAEKLYDENNEPTLEEVEANAHLIAAAPELLKACKQFISYANNGKHPAWQHYLLTIAGQKMIDAVAKAEGN